MKLDGINEQFNGLVGSSQSIADTKYTATNYPLLKGKSTVYNINNPRLGSLNDFEPQADNCKKFEGLDHFTKNSPRQKSIRKSPWLTAPALTTEGRSRVKLPRQYKESNRSVQQGFLLTDACSFSLDPSVHCPGKQLLIGNKELIKRDILNKSLRAQQLKSLQKTGAPIDEAKQTYYLDEHELEYDPATMAEGTFSQEKEAKPVFKHVLKKKELDKHREVLPNFESKSNFTWQNELHLSKLHQEKSTGTQFSTKSFFPITSTSLKFPLSSRGADASQRLTTGISYQPGAQAPNIQEFVSIENLSQGGSQDPIRRSVDNKVDASFHQRSQDIHFRDMEAPEQIIPCTAPAGGGFQTHRQQYNSSKRPPHQGLTEQSQHNQSNLKNIYINENRALFAQMQPSIQQEDSNSFSSHEAGDSLPQPAKRNLQSQDYNAKAGGARAGLGKLDLRQVTETNSGLNSLQPSINEHDTSLFSPLKNMGSISQVEGNSSSILTQQLVQMLGSPSEKKKPMVFTTREHNDHRNKSQKQYVEYERQAELGVFVPPSIQKNKYLKSVYLKNNMDQLKVIKKAKLLDPYKYRNDRGYIFYAPVDPPLDRQILERGGRVFDNNVEHQQKKLNGLSSQEDIIPNMDMNSDKLSVSILTRPDIGKLTTFDKMTLNTSSKFGISLKEHSPRIQQPEPSHRQLKRGRNAFVETGVSNNDIQNLKSSIKHSRNSKLSLKSPSFGKSQASKEISINQTLGYIEGDSKVSSKFTTSRANSTAFNSLDQMSIDASRISQVKPEIKQIQSLLKQNLQKYGKPLKKLDNCSIDQVSNISKSLTKLQKLRHRQNTCDSARQVKQILSTKSNFDNAYTFSGGPGHRAKNSYNSLILKQLASPRADPLKTVSAFHRAPPRIDAASKIFMESKINFHKNKKNNLKLNSTMLNHSIEMKAAIKSANHTPFSPVAIASSARQFATLQPAAGMPSGQNKAT